MATITMTTDGQLIDLLTWLSPSWPIGSFAYSSGIECAVEAGHVTDAGSTTAWIADMVEAGSLWNDAVLFAHAYRAAASGDEDRLAGIVELALATLTSAERRLEATAQGEAFRTIVAAATPVAALTAIPSDPDAPLPYPVAIGAAMAGRGIALAPALAGWLHAAVANLVSAALRLVPLGQTDGQRILAGLKPLILATATRAAALDDEDPFAAMGSATLLADIATIAHETQYTRLFRT